MSDDYRPSCGNCFHALRGGQALVCRLLPPVVDVAVPARRWVASGGSTPVRSASAVFPEVQPGWLCGEWRPREDTDE